MILMKHLTLKQKIEYVKAYIAATRRDIRLLRITKRKYTLEGKLCHSQVAESKIEIEEKLLAEAETQLNGILLKKREIVRFT